MLNLIRRTTPRIAAILAAALLLFASHLTEVSHAQAAGDCTVDASLDADEKTFLTLINNYRVQNGLQPLAASYALSRASAWKSVDLGVNAYFAHDDLSRTWVQRVRDCGYGFNTWLGENIAGGTQTAQQAFDIWKNSPGHNANMLGANYTSIGIGRAFVPGSQFGWYWTTDFGGFDDGWATKSGTAPPPIGRQTPLPPSRSLHRHNLHGGGIAGVAATYAPNSVSR